jgi:hypothetical protein
MRHPSSQKETAPVVAKLGREHSLKLYGVFRCQQCGNKDVEVRLSPPTR